MPLPAGEKLGPYEILAPLGKGGMGEVYRARDARLRRDVALKVSAERFSERFEKEARAIASLNHPNVCTLFDVGPNYLVMELVEGQTLSNRIKEGAVAIEEALAISGQIADALEAAHEKGITHRDLKPGNIIIKPDGAVKVLDFGLAKIGGGPTAQSDNSPTMTIGATEAGVILGTAAYMAPEQARGKSVDRRADVWAFGVVLYEMLTGQKLFRGDDLTETMAAVIKEEPKLDRVPVKVRRLLRTCLQKDPKQRLQAIGDWRLLLGEEAPAAVAKTGMPQWVWPGVAAAAILALAVSLAGYRRVTRPVDHPLVRLDVDLGADVSLPLPDQGGSGVVISPDGTRLAYLSGNPTKLFTRRLDQSKGVALAGTEGARAPFFSPDGQWIGFYAGGAKLKKISVEGGAVVPLGDFGGIGGANWGEEGSIVVGDQSKGLLLIPSVGGMPALVTPLAKGELALVLPQILPGGKGILFHMARAFDPDTTTIEVLTRADHRRKIVARGGTTARYLPTSEASGHLIYVNRATMFAVSFDLDKLEARGNAVPVLDDVAYPLPTYTGQFSFSRNGTMVYRRAAGGASPTRTLQWIDATGKKEPLLSKPGAYLNPSVSPDGRRVALMVNEGASQDIWVYDPQRDTMTRLTFGGALYFNPIWTPDGRYVIFGSGGNGTFQARADGAGQPQVLTAEKVNQAPRSFAPDGKRLAYQENAQLWTAPVEIQGGQLKAGKPERFLQSGSTDADPAFSPDGRWLAYQSDESGRPEVYVRAFPPPPSGQGGKWQISNAGGRFPHWSRTAHELIYQSGDQLLAASYTIKDDTFVPDKPRVWIAKLGVGQTPGVGWDLAPDGKRVAVITPAGDVDAPKQDHEVVVLENFFDELRRKAPFGK